MRLVRAMAVRLRALFDRPALDEELDLELRDHLEREIRANLDRGLSEAEARRAAHATFGGVQRYKEETRDTHSIRWLEDGLQDLRYALRSLRRTPGFTVVAVLTLALGVGANTAMFTVVEGVLLRPLPFREPGRLYVVSQVPKDLPYEVPPGLPDRLYLSYRDQMRAFERVAAFQGSQFTLSGVGDASRLDGARVGADFFALLGVSPSHGRSFAKEEEQPGRDGVAILSDRLWHERFGGDAGVVGTTLTLDGVPRTIVGIAPPGFDFPASSEIWTPLALRLDVGNSIILSVLGRLQPGATPQQARSELESISRAMPPDSRVRDDGRTSAAAILPLKDVLIGKVAKSLLVFSGAVAFVLLIAGANVGNLMLIRAATRRREMAVRVALGASRSRVVRQQLTESVIVALIGGALGIASAFAGVHALLTMAPADRIPRLEEVHVDGLVLAFSLAVSVVTGVLFGLVPALSNSRRPPHQDLTQASRVIGGSETRVRTVFVVAQMALALVLLTGAGLMLKSFLRMRSLDTGYDAAGVMTMAVELPPVAYPDAGRVRQFHASVLARLERIPGVQAAAAVSFRPMAGVGIMGNFSVAGPTPFPQGYTVDKPTVSPGYFSAMGIHLLRGRDFSERDDARAPGVVIVSESVARKVWPNADAVGKRISMSDRPGPGDWLTVIGVVNDVVQDGELRRHSTVYLPYLQTTSLFFLSQMTYVVRTTLTSANVAPAMRAALRETDPAVPAQALQTMDQSMLEVIGEPLFQMRLLSVFALLALLLAAIGTYGVLAYHVAERGREIAIRVALGAESARVVRMVIGDALRFAGLGVAIGGMGALATTRVLSKFLFEVSPTDPTTFGLIAALLVTVALMAGMLPARRASRIDPMAVLRSE
jgi:putative ABC transport system permease protein